MINCNLCKTEEMLLVYFLNYLYLFILIINKIRWYILCVGMCVCFLRLRARTFICAKAP